MHWRKKNACLLGLVRVYFCILLTFTGIERGFSKTAILALTVLMHYDDTPTTDCRPWKNPFMPHFVGWMESNQNFFKIVITAYWHSNLWLRNWLANGSFTSAIYRGPCRQIKWWLQDIEMAGATWDERPLKKSIKKLFFLLLEQQHCV